MNMAFTGSFLLECILKMIAFGIKVSFCKVLVSLKSNLQLFFIIFHLFCFYFLFLLNLL
jgi:hypothetical protein